jgi:MFS family permease
MFIFSAVMLGLFAFLENRVKEPILPLSLFKNRIVFISNLVSFLSGMGMFGVITFAPLFLQGVLGSSATASGNVMIPKAIAIMITAFITGQLLTRGASYRILGIVSGILACLGLFLLSLMSVSSSYWIVILYTMIFGFGMGFSVPVFTSIIQNNVPQSILGVATSSNTFIRSFGGAVGLAILGSIINNRFLSDFISGIPETVKAGVSMDSLTALANNPQALVNPAAQAQLQATLTDAGLNTAVFDQVIQTLRISLSSAITQAFFIAFCIMFIGLIATFFLKEGKPVK